MQQVTFLWWAVSDLSLAYPTAHRGCLARGSFRSRAGDWCDPCKNLLCLLLPCSGVVCPLPAVLLLGLLYLQQARKRIFTSRTGNPILCRMTVLCIQPSAQRRMAQGPNDCIGQ